jgi:hypothetical protein
MATDYDIHAEVIFRRWVNQQNKAETTVRHLKECFPYLQHFELDRVYDPRASRNAQEEWLDEERVSKLQIHKQTQVERKCCKKQ